MKELTVTFATLSYLLLHLILEMLAVIINWMVCCNKDSPHSPINLLFIRIKHTRKNRSLEAAIQVCSLK